MPERDVLDRRLRATAKTLDLLDGKLPAGAPERRLLDTLIAAFGDLIGHVLPTRDADAIDALLCAIEAGLVGLDPFGVGRDDPQAARAAERRKFRQAHAGIDRISRRAVCWAAHPPRVRRARRRRRPRTARRRAAGVRSGQDPGDEDADPEPRRRATTGATL